MKRIFSQQSLTRGYDTAVRNKALGVLLLDMGPSSQQELHDIFRQAGDPWNHEFDMYIQERLYNLMELNPNIRCVTYI